MILLPFSFPKDKQSQMFYASLIQHCSDTIVVLAKDGKVQYISPALTTVLGYPTGDWLGQPVLQHIHPEDIGLVKSYLSQLWQAPDTCLTWELRCRHAEGAWMTLECMGKNLLYDPFLQGVVLYWRNINQRKATEETLRSVEARLSWQSKHDPLTGLLNRTAFESVLLKTLHQSLSEPQPYVLCYLDIDQFRIINDACGYRAGDELLCQVASLVQNSVAVTDTFARLNSDSFGILLAQFSLEQARPLMERLRQKIQECRFIWQDKMFVVTVSIGLVELSPDTPNLTSLLNAAEAACFVAKERGRNRCHNFQPDDIELVQKRGAVQWLSYLNKALAENRFRLFFQTIRPLGKDAAAIDHYEVLLRLEDNGGQLVSPAVFIGAAERFNLMPNIDRWVIKTLFALIRDRLIPQPDPAALAQEEHCFYAINLSGASINDDRLIEFLLEEFQTSGVPPTMICFEITETVAISNLGKAAQLIRELKKLGCRFALDDFGSGMSSFGYLKNLPVDYLKIDGNFIRNIINDSIDLAMVRAIQQISQVMQIETIAEFVENQAILEAISDLGVNYAQGYAIARPAPLPALVTRY